MVFYFPVKNIISCKLLQNLVQSSSVVLDTKYSNHWARIKELTGGDAEKLISSIEKYIGILCASQHDTYTNPFEIVSPNMSKSSHFDCHIMKYFILVLGLDIITPESVFGYEPDNIPSTLGDQTYTTERVILPDTSQFLQNSPTLSQISGPIISFPKYNNYLQDVSKFDKYSKIMVPLKLLGIKPLEMGELITKHTLPENGAVLSYAEYRQAGALLPNVFDDSVVRRWGVDITIGSPLTSVSILIPEYVEAVTKNEEVVVSFQEDHVDKTDINNREEQLKKILIDGDQKQDNEAQYLRFPAHRLKRDRSVTKKLLYKSLSGVHLSLPVQLRIWLDPNITVFNERSNPQCVHWTTMRG